MRFQRYLVAGFALLAAHGFAGCKNNRALPQAARPSGESILRGSTNTGNLLPVPDEHAFDKFSQADGGKYHENANAKSFVDQQGFSEAEMTGTGRILEAPKTKTLVVGTANGVVGTGRILEAPKTKTTVEEVVVEEQEYMGETVEDEHVLEELPENDEESDAKASLESRLGTLVSLIHDDERPYLYINVRSGPRELAFSDSYIQLLEASVLEIKNGKISGGLTGERFYGPAYQKEFMSAVAAQLFNPEFGLFIRSEEVPHYSQINPEVATRHADHARMFKAVGRFFALVLARNEAIGVTLPAAFWALLTGQTLELADIKKDEPVLFKTLEYYLTAPAEELAEIPIEIDGMTYDSTVDNREELVKRKVNSLIDPKVRNLIGLIRNGLNEIVTVETISQYLSPSDLREVFIGTTMFDLEDFWANSMTYRLNGQTREWFINVVNSFDQEMLKKFLKFATNLDHIPIGGFKTILPNISIGGGDGDITDELPSVHHCFNSMNIPVYSSEDELREKLTLAILGSDWGL